jgi:hypothetical protein
MKIHGGKKTSETRKPAATLRPVVRPQSVAASTGWIARAQTYESHSHLLCSKWSVSRATPVGASATGEARSASSSARSARHQVLRTVT